MDIAKQMEEGYRNYREAMKLLEECGIEECCVCLSSLTPRLPCRHFVCLECCLKLDKCPMCRELLYALRDDWEKDLESLTQAAGLTLSMTGEELKKEIPPHNGEIVVRLRRTCYCYDCRCAAPQRWVMSSTRGVANGDILRALLHHGLRRDPDCSHPLYEGLHFDLQDKEWDIFLGS